MRFDLTKAFKGTQHAKSFPAMEAIGNLFSGNVGTWARQNELEQYGKSLYVFAAVNKIATKVAAIDMAMYVIKNRIGDSEEVFDHPLLDLLARMNAFQTRTEFLKTAWINKKLTGEAFWWKVRNNRGDVVELWNLRPDRMTIVSDPTKFVQRYELAKFDGKIEVFAPEDIIHFKDPDPMNQFRGMSPVGVARTRIETEQAATEFQRNFFKNNARPDALLLTEEALDNEQRAQMTSSWDDNHRGKGNQAKIGLLEGGMKYQQVSVNQREMDYIESSKFTRDDILVALGVPKSVITTDEVNYANAETGLRSFLAETIVPEMQQLIEVLNEFLVKPDFGEEYYLDYIDPTPSDRAAERADHTAGFGKWLTTNEIREQLNKPAIEGGDVIAVQPASPFGMSQQASAAAVQASLKRKGMKALQGRPMLRNKFEVLSQLKGEIKTQMLDALRKKGGPGSGPQGGEGDGSEGENNTSASTAKEALASLANNGAADEHVRDLLPKEVASEKESLTKVLGKSAKTTDGEGNTAHVWVMKQPDNTTNVHILNTGDKSGSPFYAQYNDVPMKASKKKESTPKKLVTLLPDITDKELFYDVVNKRLDKRSVQFKNTIIKEANAQQQRVIARLKKADIANKTIHNKVSQTALDKILNKKGEQRLFAEIALPFLVDFATKGGEDAAKLTNETFDMSPKLHKAMEKRSAFFASSVTDTTFQKLATTLSEGIDAGEGIGALTDRVQGVYSDYTDYRAGMIARTETTNANNEGMLEQYTTSDVVKGKEWIATLDERTREEHAALNGEIVAVSDNFSNGLDYPQEINCRCVIAPALDL